MGEYCDGIERINIELSIQNKLALCDALAEFLRAKRSAAARGRRQPRQRQLIGDRRPGRRWITSRLSACAGNGCSTLDLPLAEAESRFADVRRGRRRVDQQGGQPGALSTACRTIGTRVVEAGAEGAPDQDFRRHAVSPDHRAHRGIHKETCAAASSSPAHARRRRQRAHQHPGQLRQLRDAADRQQGRRAHHARWPAGWTASFPANTASASPSWNS